MRIIIIILVGGLVMLTAGHFNRNDQSPESMAEQDTKRDDTSFLSSQVEAIEKAKGVENTVMSAFQKRDAQMDAQGQ